MKNKENDLLLLKRIRNGDMTAFRIIVEKHKDVSLSLAISILKNKEEAEDILQEVFIKVFKGIRHFRANASFATWLYRIVVNTCLNAKEARIPLVPPHATGPAASEQNKAVETLLNNERKEYILKALNTIKEEESLLLRLYYLCDLKVGEIREITGLGESNIKILLYRGRKNLLEALKLMMGDEIKNLL